MATAGWRRRGRGRRPGSPAVRPRPSRLGAGARGEGLRAEGTAHVEAGRGAVVPVDDVVVDDEGGVEELDRGADLRRRGGAVPPSASCAAVDQLGRNRLPPSVAAAEGVPEPGVLRGRLSLRGRGPLEQRLQGLVGREWAHRSSSLVAASWY